MSTNTQTYDTLVITDGHDNPLPGDLLRKALQAAASMLNLQSDREGEQMLRDAFWAWPVEVRRWLFTMASDAAVEKTEQVRLKDESITAQLTAAKTDVQLFHAQLTEVMASADALTTRRLFAEVEDPAAAATADPAVVGEIKPATETVDAGPASA